MEDKIYKCKYCQRECKNLNSLKQHEIRCKQNPNHLKIISNWIKYNKLVKDHIIEKKNVNQFDKAKNEGYILHISDEVKSKIAKGWLGKKHKKESKEKIQNTILNKIKLNNWHNNNGIKIKYKDCIFDSSWEVNFVKYLDDKNILWQRPKDSFEYEWNNGIHKYIPDIYLPEYDLYIEIKGSPNERDYEKWKQFPKKLNIYDSEDLYKLGLVKAIDNRNLITEEFKYKHVIL